MSASAKSLFYFGLYLYVVGVQLILIPHLFLKLMQIPDTSEVWIRVVGMLALALGFYYHQSAVRGIRAFFPLTVPARIFAFLAFTTFAVLKLGSPMLILFGVVDLLAAGWTWRSLQKEGALQKR